MTAVLTAANPVLEAINGLLQDSTFQAAVGGRCGDSLPEDVARPCTLFSLASEKDVRGLGTGNLPECELRVYTYSEIGSLVEAQEINRQIVNLLKDQVITATGFSPCGTIVYRETNTFPDSELNGLKVHEVVSTFTLWVEA